MKTGFYRGIALTLLLTLPACGYEGAGIQQQYVDDHDECRSYAEEVTDTTTRSGMPSGNDQVLLVAYFARCMNKRGWDVNKPPADVTAEALKNVTVRGR